MTVKIQNLRSTEMTVKAQRRRAKANAWLTVRYNDYRTRSNVFLKIPVPHENKQQLITNLNGSLQELLTSNTVILSENGSTISLYVRAPKLKMSLLSLSLILRTLELCEFLDTALEKLSERHTDKTIRESFVPPLSGKQERYEKARTSLLKKDGTITSTEAPTKSTKTIKNKKLN